MELNDRYIYQVYMQRSFSLAAKRLHISQPSLSAAVAGKEKTLGFRIFDRSTKPVSLTPEGNIYIRMLEEFMESESVMQEQISRLAQNRGEYLCVGNYSHIGLYLLPVVYKAFSDRYPDVQIYHDMAGIPGCRVLPEKLRERELDIWISYHANIDDCAVIPLLEEREIIAMPKTFLTPELEKYALTYGDVCTKAYSEEKLVTDSALFRKTPFLSHRSRGVHTTLMKKFLGEYKTAPCTVVNTLSSSMQLHLLRIGMGALFTTDTAARVSLTDERDIVYFALPEELSSRTLNLLCRKDGEQKETIQNFIRLTKELCSGDWIKNWQEK